MKTIRDLKKFGFIKAGNWVLLNDGRINFIVENQFESMEDLLYAFESEDLIRYVGITEQSLKGRMINYKYGHEENKSSGFTNKFVNANIKKMLVEKKAVNIYFLKGEAECTFHSLRISLSTGIEKSLIKLFDIENKLWNSRGVVNGSKKNKGIKIDQKNNNSIEIMLSENQTIIKLGKESFEKGFILFRNDVDSLLPIDCQGMDIKYKNKVISGWFTRSFKNKKVNGYIELKLLFNNDFVFGEEVLITILNPNEIKIEKINK